MTQPIRKMSEILKEMAELLLREPGGTPSSEAMHAALLLANAAWNRSLGLAGTAESYRPVLNLFEAENPGLWGELKSRDIEAMIDELLRHKETHYPGDGRRILACGIPEGKVHVEWIAPAAPGEDPGWDMRLYGLVRAGALEEATRFVQESRKVTGEAAASRVAQAARLLGLAPALPARPGD